MGVIELSNRLMYYKRKEIQEAIVQSCRNREVGVRYGDKGFGKRPDTLEYPGDALELAKKGATSFHVSEERWSNPLHLEPMMKKSTLDMLRTGWDLVLDIDCPYWNFSKLTAHLFVKALKAHGIHSVTCKFSGNKGFHIGVPFEAFPEHIGEIAFKDWFPEGPKRIALYLLAYIGERLVRVENEDIIFDNKVKVPISNLIRTTGKEMEEITKIKCKDCGKEISNLVTPKTEFVCPRCELRLFDDSKFKQCPKCKIIMTKSFSQKPVCKCGSYEYSVEFDALVIMNVDTLLISSRHMYRSPYSLHEKSGLVSLPIHLDNIISFAKEQAKPGNINVARNPTFLDTRNTTSEEGKVLLIQAFDFAAADKILPHKKILRNTKYELIDSIQIPMELFPPCMLNILKGLDDGRKRALFSLLNFLQSVGWYDNQVAELIHDWNKKNTEPLRETYMKTHINYHLKKKDKIPPPNCRSYYQDLGVCVPDALCDKIKNPINYSRIKAGSFKKKGGKRKLTKDQKEMRRKYREKLKNNK
ncbi:hypothetical protein JW930_00585 [Candidatus Woesearchaeota archaeon]|nr:hypothetical protein [Candidatus Woesearchaeota archaeon]